MRLETASPGRSLRKQEGPLKNPRRKTRAKAGVEERPKAREKGSHATCAEELGTPLGCAPAKDELTTWSRTRPKEKTPMKTAADPKKTPTGIPCSESCLMNSPPGLRDASPGDVGALTSVAQFLDLCATMTTTWS